MQTSLIHIMLFACIFILVVSAIDHYFKHAFIPPVCWILLLGVVYGVLDAYGVMDLPQPRLEPELVFYIFLPILIFDSSRKLGLRELRTVWAETTLFATVGIVLSMFLIGVPLMWAAKIPFLDALLFGAILSATDPVAISAVFRKFPLPEKLRTIIEGESLLNDGTTVVLFWLLSKSVLNGEPFSVPSAFLNGIIVISGAVILGLAAGLAGWFFVKYWHELHDRFIGSLLPLVTVYMTFLAAEGFLHVSGVIAVMAATLILTTLHYRERHTKAQKTKMDFFFDAFWDFLGDLVNAMLFFMLGAAMGSHYFNLPLYIIPVILIILFAARSVVVYLGSGALGFIRKPLSIQWQHILNMAGLKGALSIALILMLPADYPHRELFLCSAFVMILLTLTGNTTVMHFYLKRKAGAMAQDQSETSHG